MNERSLVTKKRLYAEDRKSKRVLGITKKVARQQKSREWGNRGNREKQQKVPIPVPGSL
jgi:hypothetical protein